jgi:hypothetical protein
MTTTLFQVYDFRHTISNKKANLFSKGHGYLYILQNCFHTWTTFIVHDNFSLKFGIISLYSHLLRNTKEFISKASLLKNLPLPLFSKEGYIISLWQREVMRDFIINCLHTYDLISNYPYPPFLKKGGGLLITMLLCADSAT